MKTSFAKHHQPFAALSFAFIALCLSLGLPQSVHAVNTTLNYTNVADAWLTPASWSPANNWNSGTVKTNAATADVRLNIGTNTTVNQAVTATYNASMGTTIFNNAGVATRGFVIGSGSGTTGAVSVVGGTLVVLNGTTADSFLIGSPAASGAGSGTLTLSGGNLVYTNASGNGFGVLSVAYRGGFTNGGPYFAQGTFTINSGSTATIERTFFGFTASEAGAQCTGTINLNAGGTLSTRNIRARDSDTNQMASFLNLNGGTLRVLGPNVADTAAAFVSEVSGSTNFTVNVQAGGAVVDTAGFNATIAKGLLNAGGGGLTKNGAGTLTLSQTNTYTGGTVVNGGSLAFNLPISSSALTLASGAATTITVGNNAWTNTVTSVTNATLSLTLGAVTAVPSATTAVINTATLNVSGTNVINITSATGLPLGTVKLIDYTSGASRFGGGAFVLGTLPPGLQATLVDGPNDVSLNVTLSVRSLIWTASVNNEWATNGVLNWDSGANAYSEAYPGGIGDIVNFTDAPSTFYTVNLTSNVRPADVVLSHTTNSAVTLTGAGQIVGANGITKTGTGTTLLSISNSFSGVVSVNNGILQVDNGGALGSTSGVTTVTGAGTVMIGDGFGAGTTVTGETITLNGAGFGGSLGQLRGSIDPSSPNIWAGPIVLAANNGRIGTDINGNLTVAGPITDNGSNYIVLYRPGNGGTITVSNSAHSCAGTATFCGSGAVVKLGVANGFSTNVLQVGTGTIDLSGFNQTVSGIDVFSGNGVILNNGGGTSTLTVNTVGTNGFVATAAIQDGSQPVSVVKEGSGRQSLNSTTANTYTGNTVVNGGELRLSTTLGNTAVSLNSGALLSVGTAATVAGTITVNSGGTLSPGIPFVFGVLTNTSTVTLNAGSTNFFHLNASITNSDLLVATTVNYGGTLVVTNQSATNLFVGQVFHLVTATTPNNNFASVVIQNGGTGHFTPATGNLTIDTIPVTTPPTLVITNLGGSLEFSWTGSFKLQSQTNSLSTGLNTNWSDYPGGGTSPVTVTVDPTKGSVFFRLSQ